MNFGDTFRSILIYIAEYYLPISILIILFLEISIRRKGEKIPGYWCLIGLGMFLVLGGICYALAHPFAVLVDSLVYQYVYAECILMGIIDVVAPGCLFFLGVFLLSLIYDRTVRLPKWIWIVSAIALIIGTFFDAAYQYSFAMGTSALLSGGLSALDSLPLADHSGIAYLCRLVPQALYGYCLIRKGRNILD